MKNLLLRSSNVANATKEQKEILEQIFASNQSTLFRRKHLSEAFLRPPYQYTSIEVVDPGWYEVRNSRFDMFFELL